MSSSSIAFGQLGNADRFQWTNDLNGLVKASLTTVFVRSGPHAFEEQGSLVVKNVPAGTAVMQLPPEEAPDLSSTPESALLALLDHTREHELVVLRSLRRALPGALEYEVIWDYCQADLPWHQRLQGQPGLIIALHRLQHSRTIVFVEGIRAYRITGAGIRYCYVNKNRK